MRLLLIEDDIRLSAALRSGLGRCGFDVFAAQSAGDGLRRLDRRPEPDAVLLDLGLPDIDGLHVCKGIRARFSVPIIVISARAEVQSRIRGLNAGADDYLVKPFHLAELVARIEAIHRRTPSSALMASSPRSPDGYAESVVGPLRIDRAARTVTIDGSPKILTFKEFEILSLLADRPGVAVARVEIANSVWHTGVDAVVHTLESHMTTLRAKLGVKDLIMTVRGVGYKLMAT